METKTIKPKEYKLLSEEKKELYTPVYDKFRKKRFYNECEECGNVTGYYYHKVPVGKPAKYRPMTDEEISYQRITNLWAKKATELLDRNLVASTFLNKDKNGNNNRDTEGV